MRLKTYILSLILGLTALLGDHLGTKVSGWPLALIDNTTHGVIAAITWALILINQHELHTGRTVQQAVFCGLLSSAIDIDHFITALSWKLSDATQLKSRPFLHNSSLLLLTSCLCLLTGKYWPCSSSWTLGWLLLAAGLSHHLRDAARRGFWVWPFGSTPPVPYYFYIVLTSVLPFILVKVQSLFSAPEKVSLPYEEFLASFVV